MKITRLLDKNWQLKRMDTNVQINIDKLDEFLNNGSSGYDKTFVVNKMPSQVHDVLVCQGIIENPNIQGDGSNCLWIGESDWIYVCNFLFSPDNKESYLYFDGLDTYVDIYLNRKLIGSHNDVYIPCQIDVTSILEKSNCLVLHFKSPKKILDGIILPSFIADAENKIKPSARSRMFGSTFGDYLGPKPYLMRVGVYGEISIVTFDKAEIVNIHAPYRFIGDFETVEIDAIITLRGNTDKLHAQVNIYDSEGNLCCTQKTKLNNSETIKTKLSVCSPKLWWPRSHGEANLYKMEVILLDETNMLDISTIEIGFRQLLKVGDFEFLVNGKPIKLWGSNLAPLDTLTNVYNKYRMSRLLDIAELAHHNCIRVWGENERLADDFYQQCNRRGIFVWQDFFTTYSMYAPDIQLYDLIRKEAEYQVIRLRNHPCILLWCGGNESLLSRDYDFPGEAFWGIEIFDEIFPFVCSSLDPERYYHRSSPDGGAYANDPLGGDTHGYTHVWFVPGSHYPVFLSENCRVSTPAKRTMVKMMKPEDLWPAGYDGKQHKNNKYPWPIEWNKYNSNQGYLKLGDIESYYDATDLDSQLYRIGWGHGNYLRQRIERYRRGRHSTSSTNKRITQGHLLWKLNNSSNHIFFGVIDYFLEPYIAYYALKRAYEPVLLCFEIDDFIKLWMVNDTTKSIRGRIYIGLFCLTSNSIVKQLELPFSIEPDESKEITNLNSFGQFKKSHILCSYAVSDDGNRVAQSIDYLDIERHLRFPTDGNISLSISKNCLILSSDRFERSVELIGNNNGNEFGWLFEDNYFDLIPGHLKFVRIYGQHTSGVIYAKSYYGERTAKIDYNVTENM